MSTTDNSKEENFQKLVKTYIERPIVLYVGAGSSIGDDGCERGIPGWWGLLERVLRKGAEHASEEDFVMLDEKKDPWDAAEFVLNKMPCGHKQFQSVLWEVIRDRCHYPTEKSPESRKYKLINGKFLSQNATLNAIVAFCGGISALVEEKKKRSGGCYFLCRPNRRVRAVLTTNYDPFLESASTSKYREALLKPVAAYGSDAGNLRQIPVFHIHGYVPHPNQAKNKPEQEPFLRELVLDRASYEEAWRRTDVFGPTMLHQIHYLRGYSVLFVGFSFSDEKVNQLLSDIGEELLSRNRNHFALLSQRNFEKLVDKDKNYFDKMAIAPIPYSKPGEIPGLLGKLFRAGLEADHKGDSIPIDWVQSRTHNPSKREPFPLIPTEYWNVLLKSRLCHAKIPNLPANEE